MKMRKALVPMAGRGTRLFPATQLCKKELFPVVGPDGVVRALLHHQLRDLVQDGFTEIGVIVRPGEQALVKRYFLGSGPASALRAEVSPDWTAEVDEMARIFDCLSFIEQRSQEGFGHAVYQARDFAAGEAFLLVTGDLLYRGPCRRELARAFAEGGGRAVSGVCPIGPDQLHGYGTIAGRRLDDHPRLIEIERLIEKPSLEVAREQLRMVGLPVDRWLGWFGLHALSPGIFEILEGLIRDDIRVGGEIQLTHAQDLLRARDGYWALEMSGSERFDFGLPETIAESMVRYARPEHARGAS